MSRYEYSEQERLEIALMAKLALPTGTSLRPAPIKEDFDGIDFYWTVGGQCPLATRIRPERPDYAPDEDITLRSTEPAKITGGTYAPLLLIVWLRGGFARFGKLIDVYRLDELADPPLRERPLRDNGDGTRWLTVPVSELHETRALLRLGNRESWAPAFCDGNQRTKEIIAQYSKVPA